MPKPNRIVRLFLLLIIDPVQTRAAAERSVDSLRTLIGPCKLHDRLLEALTAKLGGCYYITLHSVILIVCRLTHKVEAMNIMYS